MRWATLWRLEDLRVGQIIYEGRAMRVDPITRRSTGELQKFRVTAITHGSASLEIYRGTEPAEMPPGARP